MGKKSCLKHSAAEFQSMHQFWLQLDIIAKARKLKMMTRGSEATPAKNRNQ